MLLSEFDYHLPAELIASDPLPERSDSRMLIVERASGTIRDSYFSALPRMLRQGDVLVLNDTKVFPARLFGVTESGAKIEVFLIKRIDGLVWEALARPARRLKPGKTILFGDELRTVFLERISGGNVIIRFECSEEFDAILDRIGKTPLPPYIKRDQSALDTDRERYQTVYAKKRGAIAAPTAGLHFTPEILADIRNRGVIVAEITLHVGYGTFERIRVDDLASHSVMPEQFEISSESAEILNAAVRDGRRIIAVGTTTTRALETSIEKNGEFIASNDLAELTILPGHRFRAIDGLLTNFHLPKSSLLVLVSTFGGHELTINAYRHAVSDNYRFYSYGDCMLII